MKEWSLTLGSAIRRTGDRVGLSLLLAIEEALGRKAQINHLPEQPGDVPLTCADISKARRLLGYEPTTPLRIGLPRFIEWFHQTRARA